jgi:hypothetical protein
VAHEPQSPATRQVLTIAQFCDDHQISRGFFNVLKQRGEAPDFIKVGRRVLITATAAAEWRNWHTVKVNRL